MFFFGRLGNLAGSECLRVCGKSDVVIIWPDLQCPQISLFWSFHVLSSLSGGGVLVMFAGGFNKVYGGREQVILQPLPIQKLTVFVFFGQNGFETTWFIIHSGPAPVYSIQCFFQWRLSTASFYVL